MIAPCLGNAHGLFVLADDTRLACAWYSLRVLTPFGSINTHTHTHTHTLTHTHTHAHTHTHGYIEHILDIRAVLTGQEPLDASCEEPLRTARLHAGMMGEEAVTTVTDSSGNHSQKTKKSSM